MASGHQPKKMVKQKLYGHALFRPQPTNLDSIRCSLGFHDEVSFDLPPGVQSSSLFNEPPTYCTRCWHRGGGSLIPPRPTPTKQEKTAQSAREELREVQGKIAELRKVELSLLKIIAHSNPLGGELPPDKIPRQVLGEKEVTFIYVPQDRVRDINELMPTPPEPRKIRNGRPPKAE